MKAASIAAARWGVISALAGAAVFGAGCGAETGLIDGAVAGDSGGGSGGGSGPNTGTNSGSGSGSGTGSSGGGSGSNSGSGSGSGSGSSSGAIAPPPPSSSGSGSGGGSGGGSGSSSGSGSGGGSGSSSGGEGSDAGAPAGVAYFEQCTGAGSALCGGDTFSFYAVFGAAAAASSSPGCTVTSVGSCAYYACGTTVGASPPGDDAGTLTVSGGSLGTPVSITADSTGAYQYSTAASVFTGEQTMAVSASGATVPAFGPDAIITPPAPTLTAPASPYVIPTTSDLTMTWTGGQTGATFLAEGQSNSGQDYFYCTWDASLGQGTVPAQILSNLQGATNGILIYGQYTMSTFAAGDYSIQLFALPYSGDTATYE